MKLHQKYPELQPHYSATHNTTPFTDKEYKSTEKLYWELCERHHISHQTALEFQRHNTCPSCTNIQRNNLHPEETLSFTHPHVAALLSPTRNRLYADALKASSRQKTVWVDTEEKFTVKERVQALTAPPANLFSARYPELAATCTGSLTGVTVGSNKAFDWECPRGHTYRSTVRNLIKRKTPCTVCSGLQLLVGVNDLATTHPVLAACVKDPSPSTITASHSTPVTFSCPTCSHEWEGQVGSQRALTTGDGAAACPVCAGKVAVEGVNDLASFLPHVRDSWHPANEFTPEQVTRGSERKILLTCTNNPEHVVETYPYVLTRTPSREAFLCKACNPGTSAGERELADFIRSLGFSIVEGDRAVLGGQELDILIPELGVAFEYNGLYWHSEGAGKSRDYHASKHESCKERGVTLYQVWEDDWQQKRPIMENMVRSKLGADNRRRLYARNTLFTRVGRREAASFLESNHIQGSVVAAQHYGLTDGQGNLVAVASFVRSHQRGELVLARYATGAHVVGGFTKILKNSIRAVSNLRGEVRRVVTFSDNMISDGGLYASNGFTAEEQLPPDYYYVQGGVRWHKSNYRKRRFLEDPALIYEPGLGERQLANLNGLGRVWDAGKVRWVLELEEMG